MKIAVILPIYNPNHKWLDEAIASVLNQKTQHELTLFIRFDGPNNGYVIPNDSRIVVIEDKYRRGLSGGVNFMFNYIIATSWSNRYHYFARIDADDIWHEDKIEKQVDFAYKNKVGVCGVWAILVDKNENRCETWPQANHEFGIDEMYRTNQVNNYFIDPSVIINARLVYDGLVHYNNAMLGGAAFELWHRLAVMKVKMASLPERLYYYRWYGEGQNSFAPQCIKTMAACRSLICDMYKNLGASLEYYVPTEDYFD